MGTHPWHWFIQLKIDKYQPDHKTMLVNSLLWVVNGPTTALILENTKDPFRVDSGCTSKLYECLLLRKADLHHVESPTAAALPVGSPSRHQICPESARIDASKPIPAHAWLPQRLPPAPHRGRLRCEFGHGGVFGKIFGIGSSSGQVRAGITR